MISVLILQSERPVDRAESYLHYLSILILEGKSVKCDDELNEEFIALSKSTHSDLES